MGNYSHLVMWQIVYLIKSSKKSFNCFLVSTTSSLLLNWGKIWSKVSTSFPGLFSAEEERMPILSSAEKSPGKEVAKVWTWETSPPTNQIWETWLTLDQPIFYYLLIFAWQSTLWTKWKWYWKWSHVRALATRQLTVLTPNLSIRPTNTKCLAQLFGDTAFPVRDHVWVLEVQSATPIPTSITFLSLLHLNAVINWHFTLALKARQAGVEVGSRSLKDDGKKTSNSLRKQPFAITNNLTSAHCNNFSDLNGFHFRRNQFLYAKTKRKKLSKVYSIRLT